MKTNNSDKQQESKDNNSKKNLELDFGIPAIASLAILFLGCVVYAFVGKANAINVLLGTFSAITAVIVLPFVIGVAMAFTGYLKKTFTSTSDAHQNQQAQQNQLAHQNQQAQQNQLAHQNQQAQDSYINPSEISTYASSIDNEASSIAKKIISGEHGDKEYLVREIEKSYIFFQKASKGLETADLVELESGCKIIKSGDKKYIKIQYLESQNPESQNQESSITFNRDEQGKMQMFISHDNSTYQNIRSLEINQLKQLQKKINQVFPPERDKRVNKSEGIQI